MPNKFIKDDTKLLNMVQDAIKIEEKRRNFRLDHEVYHTKHLTECPRRLTYRVLAFDGSENQDFRVENHNKYTANKWVDFFDECKKVSVLERDVLAADCNTNLVGKADAILRVGDFTSVLIVDSLQSTQYHTAHETGGLRNQIVNLMMVMWLVEVENGMLICENKDTNEYFMSHVIPYRPIIDSSIHKCKQLMDKAFLQQIPDRAYKNDDGHECKICEYRKTCWTNKEKETLHAQKAKTD